MGPKGYGKVRLSWISRSAAPPKSSGLDGFEYSGRFRHRWTENFLHTGLRDVPAEGLRLDFARNVSVRVGPLPRRGAGIAGVLIADPCVDDGFFREVLVGCFHGRA